MRILQVVPTYLPAYRYGGPIRSVHGLSKALAEQGHDVHVFTTNVDGPNDTDVPLGRPVDIEGVKVWYFPSKYLRRLYWSPPLAKVLAQHISGFDIVHNHSIFLWPTWAAALIACRNHIPYVISPRGMLIKDIVRRKSRWIKTIWINTIERYNFRYAAGIHFTTQLEAQEAARFNLPLPSFFIVPNGINLTETAHCEYVSPRIQSIIERGPFLLFLSRINWKKGLDRLIPALTDIPDIPLIISGNDEEDYQTNLESLAKVYGVKDRITFTGPVYGADKIALLKNAAAMVLPSYSENFGIVVLEALSNKCPVILTPEVGLADIVSRYKIGWIVKGDPTDLASKIKEVLNGKSEYINDVINKGKQVVIDEFSWERIGQNMEKIYRNLICPEKH